MEAATISTNTEISNLDQCPNLDFISFMDHSLYIAAVQGNIDAFKQHFYITAPNKNTILQIYITARSKDEQASLDLVKAILDMCPNLLWQINNKDETLLHIAARHGHDDIVNLLIETSKATHFNDQENGLGDAKQLLKRMTKAKDTALHEAVRFKHIDVVEILIKENVCELHEINSGGETPFYLAVERGYKDTVKEMKHSAKAFRA